MIFYASNQTTGSTEECFLLAEQLPIVKVEFSALQIQIMLQQLPTVLAKVEADLTAYNEKTHRFNAVKQQFRQNEKRLYQLQKNWAGLQVRTLTNALKYYGEVAFYLEFLFQKLPIKENRPLIEEIAIHKNKVKDIQQFIEILHQLFKQYFQFQPRIQPNDYPVDELGISAEEQTISYYIFAGFDVLYNYPTLFKYQDIPSMVYNIAASFPSGKVRGQTKTTITQLAYQRVMEGMVLKSNPHELFKFSFQPQYKLQLSDYVLPLVDERQRFMVYAVEKCEEMVGNSSSDHHKKMQVGDFIVCTYADKQSSELDRSHIPIRATFLKNELELKQFVATLKEYRTYHAILLQQFLTRKEGVT